MRIERMHNGDDARVVAAAHLFDGPPRAEATARFLAQPGHHLLIAYDHDRPVGFASGVEMIHPDKGAEMLLYELTVDEPVRRRGVGRALVDALVDVARDSGCYAMWVLTDDDNVAAIRTYRAAGATRDVQQVMFEWDPLPEQT